MMRACPICQVPPVWHHARNVTRKEGRSHSILAACDHFSEVRNWKPVADVDRPAVEATVAECAERIFATYTVSIPWNSDRRAAWLKKHPGKALPEQAEGLWSDASRLAFRARIWPGADAPESTGEPWEAFGWVKDARARLRTLLGLTLTQPDDCPY